MRKTILSLLLILGTALSPVTGQPALPYSFRHAVSRQVPTETMPAIQAKAFLPWKTAGTNGANSASAWKFP